MLATGAIHRHERGRTGIAEMRASSWQKVHSIGLDIVHQIETGCIKSKLDFSAILEAVSSRSIVACNPRLQF